MGIHDGIGANAVKPVGRQSFVLFTAVATFIVALLVLRVMEVYPAGEGLVYYGIFAGALPIFLAYQAFKLHPRLASNWEREEKLHGDRGWLSRLARGPVDLPPTEEPSRMGIDRDGRRQSIAGLSPRSLLIGLLILAVVVFLLLTGEGKDLLSRPLEVVIAGIGLVVVGVLWFMDRKRNRPKR